jgi:hypothetical protein
MYNISMIHNDKITNKEKETMKTEQQIKDEDRAKDQARAQFESIIKMMTALKDADEADNEDAREDVRQTISEDPLSVRIRDGWRNVGEKAEVEEFEILLCTGGPAVRIIGELGQYNEPERATIQYQDWFTSWTDYPLDSVEDDDILLSYCRCFYFEE